jgi:hypothetical protein
MDNTVSKYIHFGLKWHPALKCWFFELDGNIIYLGGITMAQAEKQSFVNACILVANQAKYFMDLAPDLKAEYTDNGWNAAGTDPITDADLTALGIKSSDLQAFLNTCDQFVTFCTNGVPTVAQHGRKIRVISRRTSSNGF